MKARIPPLLTRYRILTVTTFLRAYGSVVNRSMFIFITEPAPFYVLQWLLSHRPQCTLVRSFISPLRVLINIITRLMDRRTTLEMNFRNIFPQNAKLLSSYLLNRLLEDNFACIQPDAIITTDGHHDIWREWLPVTSGPFLSVFSLHLAAPAATRWDLKNHSRSRLSTAKGCELEPKCCIFS